MVMSAEYVKAWDSTIVWESGDCVETTKLMLEQFGTKKSIVKHFETRNFTQKLFQTYER